jgi:hypothetical protein
MSSLSELAFFYAAFWNAVHSGAGAPHSQRTRKDMGTVKATRGSL